MIRRCRQIYFIKVVQLTMSVGEGSENIVIPWPNKKDDYVLEESIGVGATATVYKVRKFFALLFSFFVVVY